MTSTRGSGRGQVPKFAHNDSSPEAIEWRKARLGRRLKKKRVVERETNAAIKAASAKYKKPTNNWLKKLTPEQRTKLMKGIAKDKKFKRKNPTTNTYVAVRIVQGGAPGSGKRS